MTETVQRLLPSALGVTALLVALALAVSGSAPTALEVIARDTLIVAFAGIAAVIGLLVLTSASESTECPELPPPPEPPNDGTRPVTEPIDRALERPDAGERGHTTHVKAYQRCRQAALTVLTEHYDTSPERARELLDDGTWTDDPRARAFLSRTIDLPLRIRLVDWAYGEIKQRGLEAAIAEIERLATEGTRSLDEDNPTRSTDTDDPAEDPLESAYVDRTKPESEVTR